MYKWWNTKSGWQDTTNGDLVKATSWTLVSFVPMVAIVSAYESALWLKAKLC